MGELRARGIEREATHQQVMPRESRRKWQRTSVQVDSDQQAT